MATMEKIKPAKQKESSPVGTLSPKLINKLISLAAAKNCPLPVMDYVLLDGKNQIVVGDLETRIIIPFTSDINALIDTKKFQKLLTVFADGTLTMNKKTREVEYKSGNDIIKMVSPDPTEYPIYPFEFGMSVGEVSDKTIEQLVESLPFTGADEFRPMMSQVYAFDKIAATDAHRMIYQKIAGGELSQPVLFTQKVIKMLNEIGGNWKVNTDKFNIWIELESTTGIKILFRQCEDRFPRFEAVIPEPTESKVISRFDSEYMIKIIDKASNFWHTTTKQVKFNFTNVLHKSNISCEDPDFQTEFQTKVNVISDGDIEIGFNGIFLREILKNISGEVSMRMSAPSKAVVLNEKYLLMPVMLYASWTI